MGKQKSTLSFAVRPVVLFKLAGQLLLVLALLTLPPVIVALLCGEFHSAVAYAAAAGLFAIVGGALNRLPRPASLQENEAFVLAALTFLLISLAMAFPFMVVGLEPVDAFFEATSACTTTGLSTYAQIEDKPASFLFTRAWMQWYGGLGIVVFSMALIVRPGMLAKAFAAQETKEFELLSSAKTHARRVLIAYLVMTCLAVAVLWVFSRNLFYAVTYSLAAVSTGGFSPHNANLAGFETPWMAPLVTLFCVAGCLPLYVYCRAYTAGWRDLFRDAQVRAIGLACLFSAGALTVLLGAGEAYSWSQSLYHGPLLALSAQTTTGFSTTNVAELDSASKLLLMLAMLIGGGVGSTAGGVKVLRLLILLRVVQQMVIRTCLPTHAVYEPKIADRLLGELEVRDALVVALLFAGVIVFSWFAFLLLGEDPLNSLFDVVSATGTVGLSTGICRLELPALLKIVLCVDMLMGRLEVFAWLVVLHRATWFGKRAE
jgi:trk system potassium uptake protein TrkH